MNKLYYFVETLVKYWPFMTEGQKNEICRAIETGNIIQIIKILKEAEIANEDKTN
jgi:hypothetical protein